MSAAGMRPPPPPPQNQRYQYQVVEDVSKGSVEEDASEMPKNSEEGPVAMPTRRSIDEGTSSRPDGVVVTWSGGAWWTDWQLPVFVVLFAVVGVLAITFVVLLWLKNQMLSSSKHKDLAAPSSGAEGQQWIYHPVMKPAPEPCDSAGVQPPVQSALPEGMIREERRPEPVRIKAKGLLERRGSSASLTIDLHPSQENLATVVTPTRECSTEEYLLSAGNVLSRGQLRSCLRDSRSLHREFWDLPLNHPEKAEVPGSGTKNRYRSILPNERSRVRLPSCKNDLLAGYINANYVRGYDGEERAYIATQGPLPHTLADFWLMVWNETCPVIVMITKLWEKGRPKCEQYFPQGEVDGENSSNATAVYGDVSVSVTKIVHRDGYVIRELLAQRGSESRKILHFWYDTWPDHKTPPSPHAIVAMAREVENARQRLLPNSCPSTPRQEQNGAMELELDSGRWVPSGPVVVHCSAGIGRTGCFIAVSVGMNQLMEENNVDILGIVCQMRYDRGGMIQTAEQYEFVHRALCLFERSLPDQSGE
ncbi:tyrosine-protein phosphatase non-receptor type 5 isoform X2 [Anabrus simplex]